MLFINIAGIALIALIVWWFWLYTPKQMKLGEGDWVIAVSHFPFGGWLSFPARW